MTRFKSRMRTQGAKRTSKQVGAALLAAAAEQMSKAVSIRKSPREFFGGTKTQKKRKAGDARAKALWRGRKKRVKTTKQRAIRSANLRGVGKKFVSKVQKVIAHSKNWAKYTGIQQRQLRQALLDQWNMVFTDEQGNGFIYGSALEMLHVASVLFNSKPDSNLWTGTNIDDRIKLNIQTYTLDFFFKSTSSHVVNIEMYECTSKDNSGDVSPWTHIINSYTNNTMNIVNGYSVDAGGAVKLTPSYTDLSSTSEEWVDLYENFYVKKHSFKLQPGDHTSLHINVYKNKVLDISKEQSAGSVDIYTKGSKAFVFRVLNDITVSAGDAVAGDPPVPNPFGGNGIGDIHNWPSNTIGGVAMRCQKTIRMTAPNMPDKNALGSWSDTNVLRRLYLGEGFGVDQQVTVNNPNSSTTVILG